MSMSTNVVGFKPPGLKWKQMKAIYDACVLADVRVPDEVDRYFGGEPPDDAGVTLHLLYPKLHPAVTEYSTDNGSGFEINLSLLPSDVAVLRFVNSW